VLLKKAAGVDKGSAQVEKVGSITMEQLAVSAVRAGAESVTCREPEPRVKVLTVPRLACAAQ